MAFKNPAKLADSIIADDNKQNPTQTYDSNEKNDFENDKDYQMLSKMGYNADEINEILELGRKSERERQEANKTKKLISEMKSGQKKFNSSDDEFKTVVNTLKEQFGITNDFNKGLYMLPDGTMLNGAGGGSWHRNIDHREINSGYLDNNIELDEKDIGGNSHYMEDFMSHGAVRIHPENNSIQITGPLTSEQKNAILNLVSKKMIDEIELNNKLHQVKTYEQVKNILK